MKGNKVRTTVYIDAGIRDLITAQDGNLSAIVETLLEQYCGSNSVEACKIEIKKAEKTIKIMQKKVKSLRKLGVKTKKEDNFYDEILKSAKKRVANGVPLNIGWITGPINISKCRMIGIDPILILEKIKKDMEKGEHENNIREEKKHMGRKNIN